MNNVSFGQALEELKAGRKCHRLNLACLGWHHRQIEALHLAGLFYLGEPPSSARIRNSWSFCARAYFAELISKSRKRFS